MIRRYIGCIGACLVAVATARPVLEAYPQPAQGGTAVPLNGFSFLIRFDQTVQQGDGDISITKDGGNFAASVSCYSSALHVNQRYAVVPIVTELTSNKLHSVSIASTCFKNTAGEILSGDQTGYSWTTLTKGSSDITQYDLVSPTLLGPLSNVAMPSSPLRLSWVSPTTSFKLYFSEAVQGGFSSVEFSKIAPSGETTVHELLSTIPSSKVQYDAQTPGKVTITPNKLVAGFKYQMSFESGTFKDKANNYMDDSVAIFHETAPYIVKVSTAIKKYYPDRFANQNVTKKTNLVLEFADHVSVNQHLMLSQLDPISLCKSWTPTDFCKEAVKVSRDHIMVLGNKAIINPLSDLSSGQNYNVSIPQQLFLYYEGLSAISSRGDWYYTFTVESEGAADTEKPELVASAVDCSGNGDVAEKCDWDGDAISDFVEATGSVDANTGVLTTTKFKLYFKERVEVASNSKATLQQDDAAGSVSVIPNVGTLVKDCVVTIDPALSQGKLYTLTLGSGVITDDAPSKNPYMGTSFTFYTPLPRPSTSIANEATNVAKSTSLGFTFVDTPRIGFTASNQALKIEENITGTGGLSYEVPMNDPAQVRFQDKQIMFTPNTRFLSGKTYFVTLPKHSIRYMTQDLTFMFTMRAEDVQKPVVVSHYPSGTLARIQLDKLAPYVLFSESVSARPGKQVYVKNRLEKAYTILASDSACGTGGTTADACVTIDSVGTKVSFYPRGKTSTGGVAAWATSYATFTVEIEPGAFTDELTTGSDFNSVDNTTFTFRAATDNEGPKIASGSPPMGAAGLEINMNKVFLTFNEVVEKGSDGDGLAIKSWNYFGNAVPQKLQHLRKVSNNARQIITLTFDTAIQAGAGAFRILTTSDDSALGSSVASSDSLYAGSNVIIKPTVGLAAGTSYYVRSTATNYITSSVGIASQGGVDSREYGAIFTGSSDADDTTLPAPVWSTLDDYVCIRADGTLDDVVLYMNEEIKSVDTDRNTSLYSCGASCDTDSFNTPPSDTLVWSLESWTQATSFTKLKYTINPAKKYKVTIGTGSLVGRKGANSNALSSLTKYFLWLEQGLLIDFSSNDNNNGTKRMSLPFWTCQARFDTPSTNLLRLYAPTAFATTATGATKQFQVLIPLSGIKDTWGNQNTVQISYSFEHELLAPTLDTWNSNPRNMRNDASTQENIVLAFNEVVQAGTGCFEIWDEVDEDGPKWYVDVEKISEVSTAGHNVISGKHVSITPRTLCNETVYCTDLAPSTTYYMKTDRPGVLKDVIGNSLAEINTQNIWKWTTGVPTEERGQPQVAFVGGYKSNLPFTSVKTLVGYVFFTERIAKFTGTLSIEGCGADHNCEAAGDNDPIIKLPDTQLSFGAGNVNDGSSELGSLRFQRLLPTYGRRYRVTIPRNFIRDSNTDVENIGPFRDYTFYVELGNPPQKTLPGGNPEITLQSPINVARNVPINSPLTLYFNEDVQSGSGTLQFCLNRDAHVDGIVTCTDPAQQDFKCSMGCLPGKFADEAAATFDSAAAVIDRRQVTMSLSKNLKIGQRLYVLMPKGFIKDASPSSSEMGKVETTMYRFTIVEEDTSAPAVQYNVKPTALNGANGVFHMYFSEALQAGGGTVGINDVTGGGNLAVTGLSTTISGNRVSVSKTSWARGKTYRLNIAADAFKDLAGNTMSGSLATTTFQTSSDNAAPAMVMSPAHTSTTAQRHDSFRITFNEVVQKGTGKISIYSIKSGAGCPDNTCTGGTLYKEVDVSSLELLSYLNPSNNPRTKQSIVTIDPTPLFQPDTTYSLSVPSGSFHDDAFNPNGAVLPPAYRMTATLLKDQVAPSLYAVDFDPPNPGFTGSSITMYWTEAVQVAPTLAGIKLMPSDGGSVCALGKKFCPNGQTCNSDCDYTEAGNPVLLSTLVVEGSKVTAEIPTNMLQAGKGYKLLIEKNKFSDMAGNMNSQVDGTELLELMSASLRVYDTSDKLGPHHVTYADTTPKVVPTDNTINVMPSTTVKITFNEVVQAGLGNIAVGSTGIPVSSCNFAGTEMVCKPHSDLRSNTGHMVSYSPLAVTDASGNSLQKTIGTNSKLSFTTIDLDYTAPTLTGTTGQSISTRRLTAGASGVMQFSRSPTILLSFSETIQAGSGNILVKDCSPGDATKCYDGVTETVADTTEKSIDVQGGTADTKLYFNGSSILLSFQGISQGKEFALRTDAIGVFTDTASPGRPLPKITSGFEFVTAAADTTPPTLIQRYPKADVTVDGANNAPSTDITLWFSEAIQAAPDPRLKNIVVYDGITSNSIPVDNSDPSQGTVTVTDSMVVVDPFDDMGYDQTVMVTIATGAFVDLFGNPFAGFDGQQYKFRTTSYTFEKLKEQNMTIPQFWPREGAVLHHTKSGLFLFAGRTDRDCYNDVFTSTTGATWSSIAAASTDKNRTLPAVANAPTTQDAQGCVLLMGGQCNNVDTNVIWKTCNGGVTWSTLPKPISLPIYDALGAPWPDFFFGHAIAIVGGWQLVVVDAVRGEVWQFQDSGLLYTMRILSSTPFATRSDPILLATSNGGLYLMGGHNCGSDVTCKSNNVFTDVWLSLDVGLTWKCQTSNYNPAITEPYSRGIGRYVAATMTHDDTVFLIGGQKPNTTVGLSTAWMSYAGPYDGTKPDEAPYVLIPNTQAATTAEFKLCFKEEVLLGTGTLQVRDQSNTDVVITTKISRQVLTITSPKAWIAGYQYQVQYSEGFLTDTAGNKMAAKSDIYFNIINDVTAPSLQEVIPSGYLVPPWTTVTLVMTEKVFAGAGSLVLACDCGENVRLPITSAILVHNRVFFSLINGTQLRAGAKYTVQIPKGLLKDQAGNEMALSTIHTFTIVTGEAPEDDNSTDPIFVNDTYPPRVSMIEPFDGETEIDPSLKHISVWFTEDVQIGSGTITLKHPQGASQDIKITVPSKNVSISGSKMSIAVDHLVSTAGVYYLRMPKGIVADLFRMHPDGIKKAGGNSFKGLPIVDASLGFQVAVADTTKPTLDPAEVILPPNEDPVTFNSPVSVSMLLSFSETVQASQGTLKLTAQYTSPDVTINMTSDTVMFVDKQIFVAPPDLMPGEVYSLSVDPTAILDIQGNPFNAGITHKISTAPLIRFQQIPMASDSEFFGQPRYAAATTVDTNNNIYVVGGYNGSLKLREDRFDYLNDVYVLKTKLETNCASSFQEKSECSAKVCTGSPPTLGTATSSRVVWRAPSAAGVPCLDSDGQFKSIVGQVLAGRAEPCPCPKCLGAPPVLPTQMTNTSYLTAYTLVSAANGQRALYCRQGYHPSGMFTCVPDTQYVGKWKTPYPQCLPDGCPYKPPPILFQGPLVTPQCNNNSAYILLPNGTECDMLCRAGYKPVDHRTFTCISGTYTGFDWQPDGVPDHSLPECEEQACKVDEIPETADGKVICIGNVTEKRLSAVCQVLCDPGFEAQGASIVRCAVQSSVPESPPSWTKPAQCIARSCGDLTLEDPLGVILSYSSKVAKGYAEVGCATGHQPSAGSVTRFTCTTISSLTEARVAWVGSLVCAKKVCDSPEDAHGVFSCSGVKYQDTCQLSCDLGFEVSGGNGLYNCDGDRFVGLGNCTEQYCGEPPAVAYANSNDCGTRSPNGASCSIQCAAGYFPVGEYGCEFGQWTQFPACVPSGSSVVQRVYLLDGFDANITFMRGGDMKEFSSSEGWQTSVREAIAEAMSGLESNVTRRRLSENHSPNAVFIVQLILLEMTEVWTIMRITYKMWVNDKPDGEQHIVDMKLNKVTFKKLLERGIEKREASVDVTAINEFMDPVVIVEYEVVDRPADETSDQGKEEIPVQAILGSLFGIALGLLIVGGLFIWHRKRHKQLYNPVNRT